VYLDAHAQNTTRSGAFRHVLYRLADDVHVFLQCSDNTVVYGRELHREEQHRCLATSSSEFITIVSDWFTTLALSLELEAIVDYVLDFSLCFKILFQKKRTKSHDE
jgi:hypothetical protein